MQINTISPVSYRAQVPKNLHEELFAEARKHGIDAGLAYLKKSKQIQNWGSLDATSLAVVEQKTKENVTRVLTLINNYAAPFKRVLLPKKETLLDSFMSLNEKTIIDAENKLKI